MAKKKLPNARKLREVYAAKGYIVAGNAAVEYYVGAAHSGCYYRSPTRERWLIRGCDNRKDWEA